MTVPTKCVALENAGHPLGDHLSHLRSGGVVMLQHTPPTLPDATVRYVPMRYAAVKGSCRGERHFFLDVSGMRSQTDLSAVGMSAGAGLAVFSSREWLIIALRCANAA